MTTSKILTLTLLATSLLLNAAIPETLVRSIKVQRNSISQIIAFNLFNNGIEKKTAVQLSHNLIGENEELFSLMLHNYIHSSELAEEKVYAQLSKLALRKQEIDFTSYSSLIKFTQSIQNTQVSSSQLDKFASLSSRNSLLSQVFA